MNITFVTTLVEKGLHKRFLKEFKSWPPEKQKFLIEGSNGIAFMNLALKNKRLDMFLTLKDLGVDVNRVCGCTLLVEGVNRIDSWAIHCLCRNGADVNVPISKKGETVVFYAVQRNLLEIVNIFLEFGANINQKTNLSETLLHCATSVEMYELLISKKPKLNVVSSQGVAPIYRAVLTCPDSLELFCKANVLLNVPILKVPNEEPTTLLGFIVSENRMSVLDLFVRYGANVNMMDEHDNTPLHIAASIGRLNMVKRLILHGANLHARNKNGRTPLFLSAEKGFKEIFVELAKNGSDLMTNDNEYVSIFQLGGTNMLRFIIQYVLDNRISLRISGPSGGIIRDLFREHNIPALFIDEQISPQNAVNQDDDNDDQNDNCNTLNSNYNGEMDVCLSKTVLGLTTRNQIFTNAYGLLVMQ